MLGLPRKGTDLGFGQTWGVQGQRERERGLGWVGGKSWGKSKERIFTTVRVRLSKQRAAASRGK